MQHIHRVRARRRRRRDASLNLIRAKHPGMMPDDTRAMLMMEVDGATTEIPGATERILQACQNPGLIQAAAVADTQSLWAARKALSPLLRDIVPRKINEDIVVPVSRLPELLNGLRELSTKHRIANANFGHAGNGMRGFYELLRALEKFSKHCAVSKTSLLRIERSCFVH